MLPCSEFLSGKSWSSGSIIQYSSALTNTSSSHFVGQCTVYFGHFQIKLSDYTFYWSKSSLYLCKKVSTSKTYFLRDLLVLLLATSPTSFSYPTQICTQKNLCLVHHVVLHKPYCHCSTIKDTYLLMITKTKNNQLTNLNISFIHDQRKTERSGTFASKMLLIPLH